jgi:hypothetical protein
MAIRRPTITVGYADRSELLSLACACNSGAGNHRPRAGELAAKAAPVGVPSGEGALNYAFSEAKLPTFVVSLETMRERRLMIVGEHQYRQNGAVCTE